MGIFESWKRLSIEARLTLIVGLLTLAMFVGTMKYEWGLFQILFSPFVETIPPEAEYVGLHSAGADIEYCCEHDYCIGVMYKPAEEDCTRRKAESGVPVMEKGDCFAPAPDWAEMGYYRCMALYDIPDPCEKLLDKIEVHYDTSCGDVFYDPVSDVDKDGDVDLYDVVLVNTHYDDKAWCEEKLEDTYNPCVVTTTTVPPGGMYGYTYRTVNIILPGVKVCLDGYCDVSDSSGYYEINGVPPGIYDMKATKTGYYGFEDTWEITAGYMDDVDIELAPIPTTTTTIPITTTTVPITTTVPVTTTTVPVTTTTVPGKGVVFGKTYVDEEILPDVIVCVNTYCDESDFEGSFRITDVEPGTYILTAEKEGYKGPRVSYDVTEGDNPIDIVLVEIVTTTTTIPVTTTTIKPEKGYIDCYSDPSGASIILDGEDIEKETHYTIEVEPGDYTVEFELEGYKSYSEDVFVSKGEIVTVSATLEAIAPVIPSWVYVIGVVAILGGLVYYITVMPK